MKKEKIADLVRKETEGFLSENGLELYHVDFKKEGKDWYLNVYIDKSESVRESAAEAKVDGETEGLDQRDGETEGLDPRDGETEGLDPRDGETEGFDPRYVNTEDCEKVSEFLSARLDELDPIEQNYVLLVSSPGMDRELYEQKDFDRFKGDAVVVKLYKQVDGAKEHTGKLISRTDEKVTIEKEDGGILEFETGNVAKVNLEVVF